MATFFVAADAAIFFMCTMCGAHNSGAFYSVDLISHWHSSVCASHNWCHTLALRFSIGLHIWMNYYEHSFYRSHAMFFSLCKRASTQTTVEKYTVYLKRHFDSFLTLATCFFFSFHNVGNKVSLERLLLLHILPRIHFINHSRSFDPMASVSERMRERKGYREEKKLLYLS